MDQKQADLSLEVLATPTKAELEQLSEDPSELVATRNKPFPARHHSLLSKKKRAGAADEKTAEKTQEGDVTPTVLENNAIQARLKNEQKLSSLAPASTPEREEAEEQKVKEKGNESDEKDLVSIATPPRVEKPGDLAKFIPKWLLDKSFQEYPSLQVLKQQESKLRLPSPMDRQHFSTENTTDEQGISYDQGNIQVFPLSNYANHRKANQTEESIVTIGLKEHLEAIELLKQKRQAVQATVLNPLGNFAVPQPSILKGQKRPELGRDDSHESFVSIDSSSSAEHPRAFKPAKRALVDIQEFGRSKNKNKMHAEMLSSQIKHIEKFDFDNYLMRWKAARDQRKRQKNQAQTPRHKKIQLEATINSKPRLEKIAQPEAAHDLPKYPLSPIHAGRPNLKQVFSNQTLLTPAQLAPTPIDADTGMKVEDQSPVPGRAFDPPGALISDLFADRLDAKIEQYLQQNASAAGTPPRRGRAIDQYVATKGAAYDAALKGELATSLRAIDQDQFFQSGQVKRRQPSPFRNDQIAQRTHRKNNNSVTFTDTTYAFNAPAPMLVHSPSLLSDLEHRRGLQASQRMRDTTVAAEGSVNTQTSINLGFLKEISRDIQEVTASKVDTGYRRKVNFKVARSKAKVPSTGVKPKKVAEVLQATTMPMHARKDSYRLQEKKIESLSGSPMTLAQSKGEASPSPPMAATVMTKKGSPSVIDCVSAGRQSSQYGQSLEQMKLDGPKLTMTDIKAAIALPSEQYRKSPELGKFEGNLMPGGNPQRTQMSLEQSPTGREKKKNKDEVARKDSTKHLSVRLAAGESSVRLDKLGHSTRSPPISLETDQQLQSHAFRSGAFAPFETNKNYDQDIQSILMKQVRHDYQAERKVPMFTAEISFDDSMGAEESQTLSSNPTPIKQIGLKAKKRRAKKVVTNPIGKEAYKLADSDVNLTPSISQRQLVSNVDVTAASNPPKIRVPSIVQISTERNRISSIVSKLRDNFSISSKSRTPIRSEVPSSIVNSPRHSKPPSNVQVETPGSKIIFEKLRLPAAESRRMVGLSTIVPQNAVRSLEPPMTRDQSQNSFGYIQVKDGKQVLKMESAVTPKSVRKKITPKLGNNYYEKFKMTPWEQQNEERYVSHTLDIGSHFSNATEQALGHRMSLDQLTDRISSRLQAHVRVGSLSPKRNHELQLVLEKIRLARNGSLQAHLSQPHHSLDGQLSAEGSIDSSLVGDENKQSFDAARQNLHVVGMPHAGRLSGAAPAVVTAMQQQQPKSSKIRLALPSASITSEDDSYTKTENPGDSEYDRTTQQLHDKSMVSSKADNRKLHNSKETSQYIAAESIVGSDGVGQASSTLANVNLAQNPLEPHIQGVRITDRAGNVTAQRQAGKIGKQHLGGRQSKKTKQLLALNGKSAIVNGPSVPSRVKLVKSPMTRNSRVVVSPEFQTIINHEQLEVRGHAPSPDLGDFQGSADELSSLRNAKQQSKKKSQLHLPAIHSPRPEQVYNSVQEREINDLMHTSFGGGRHFEVPINLPDQPSQHQPKTQTHSEIDEKKAVLTAGRLLEGDTLSSPQRRLVGGRDSMTLSVAAKLELDNMQRQSRRLETMRLLKDYDGRLKLANVVVADVVQTPNSADSVHLLATPKSSRSIVPPQKPHLFAPLAGTGTPPDASERSMEFSLGLKQPRSPEFPALAVSPDAKRSDRYESLHSRAHKHLAQQEFPMDVLGLGPNNNDLEAVHRSQDHKGKGLKGPRFVMRKQKDINEAIRQIEAGKFTQFSLTGLELGAAGAHRTNPASMLQITGTKKGPHIDTK